MSMFQRAQREMLLADWDYVSEFFDVIILARKACSVLILILAFIVRMF